MRMYFVRYYNPTNNDHCETICNDREQAFLLAAELEKRGMQDVYWVSAEAESLWDADMY